ncbi:4Fe-4S binding protein [Prevotella sp. PINT]|jgi:Formate hydrogenlyase subunit 6/NADH:ubiquinone oxidoreductase 23 kD subunit (chain I)|uniref:4Fe-4S binding protein n=1 Tax=Palleniella intestinalis TaxID=2736291 RepID=UPI0015526A18|nr:4Fe-4S binding protein [Palleniella intestinalis]NPD81583.1 4Fe-4S binding protein [Palleniella intestinalis]
MSKIIGAIEVNKDRCKGCALCAAACPKGVIAMSKKVNACGYPYAEAINDSCIGCASCGIVCPDGCITVYKKKIED